MCNYSNYSHYFNAFMINISLDFIRQSGYFIIVHTQKFIKNSKKKKKYFYRFSIAQVFTTAINSRGNLNFELLNYCGYFYLTFKLVSDLLGFASGIFGRKVMILITLIQCEPLEREN